MDPRDEKQVDLRVADQLQKFTGTPPQQLRGLTVAQDAFDSFIARSLAEAPPPSINPPDSEVTSSIISPPTQSSPKTNEQPITPFVAGTGTDTTLGVLNNIIIIFAGTAYYNDINGVTTGPV